MFIAVTNRKSRCENFDPSINDSSSETVEFSESETGSLSRTVTTFFPEPEHKYFINEIEDLADGENEGIFSLYSVAWRFII